MEPEDFLSTYVRAMTEKMNEEMEKAITNYLIQNGYMKEDEDVIEVAARLKREGLCVRCEQFVKFNPDTYTATSIFIPFVEPMGGIAMSRLEIYKILRLSEQGYQI